MFPSFLPALSSPPNQMALLSSLHIKVLELSLFSPLKDKRCGLLEKGSGLPFSAVMERHNSEGVRTLSKLPESESPII